MGERNQAWGAYQRCQRKERRHTMRQRMRVVLMTLAVPVVVVMSGCAATTAQITKPPATPSTSQLPNPAAVYCEEQGYDYQIRTAADGSQYGVCVFDDASECDGWAYYRHTCGPDQDQGLTPSDDGSAAGAPVAEENSVDEWLTYENVEYGVSFRYPSSWSLTAVAAGEERAGGLSSNAVHLNRGTLRLVIEFKRPDEATIMGPGGRPAGDVYDRGTVALLGQEIPRHVLVYEGKDKSVFCGERFADLEFYVQLDGDSDDVVSYDAIELTADAQAEVDAIVESFARHPSADPVMAQTAQDVSVSAWLAAVVSTPDGAQFDDYLVLQPEGAGNVGVSGATDELEAEIQTLRDKAEPGKYAHFWGTLLRDVPDYGSVQLRVTRLRYGPVDTEPEPVEGWQGVLVANPPGSQFDDYLLLAGDYPVGYGIAGLDTEN